MDATIEDWNRIVAVNMMGVWLGTKVCAPALAESGRSSRHGSAIVNLSSIAGIVGSQLDPLYSMTKGGVTLFTKSAALSFAGKGWKIRVNSIHPGVIETDMGAQTFVARASQAGKDVESARNVSMKAAPDRPAWRRRGHRARHCVPGVRRCGLHDRIGNGGRRWADRAVSSRALPCRATATAVGPKRTSKCYRRMSALRG